MRKFWKWALIPAALLAAMLLLRRDPLPGWENVGGLSHPRTIQREILQAAKLLDANADGDTQEAFLIAAGYPAIDTDAVYPEYLANPEGLRAFAEGERDSVGIFRLLETGGLRYLCFQRQGEEAWFFTADLAWNEGGQLALRETAFQPVYDLELADWDIFYYRLYPAGDPHYIDYTQLRLTPPDRERYDLTRKYILPVGYQMVNLFLVDWQEGDWGELSFPDLLEALYTMETGQTLSWEDLPQKGEPVRRMIPAALFEGTILPYFAITQEDLRALCQYDAELDAYPWRPVHGDDLTAWKYPMCEPEVVSVQENGDGTLTLTVQVYSPELKTDRLFCHELTVRPEGEGFRYVGNRITFVSQRGLPPSMSRFDLDR